MYHIPKFFGHSSSTNATTKRNKHKLTNKGGPRLQRLNAQKGIDYTPRETRSLDIDNTTSFRIQGREGELDSVYQYLGISGPDDLGISIHDWEARKLPPKCVSTPSQVKSVDLDSSGGSRPSQIVGSLSQIVRISTHVDDDNNNSKDQIKNEIESQLDRVSKSNGGRGGRNGIKGVRPPVLIPPADGMMPYCIPMYDMKVFDPEVKEDVDDGGGENEVSGGSKGIKGVRPPVLITSPDAVRYSVASYVLDSFGSGERGGDVGQDDDGEGEDEEFIENECAENSESCSFTTNDDDSSSTTTENVSPTLRTRSYDGSSVRTEPPSYISPNGGVRRIVTNWTKGKLLGRGSFGSVYEGYAE